MSAGRTAAGRGVFPAGHAALVLALALWPAGCGGGRAGATSDGELRRAPSPVRAAHAELRNWEVGIPVIGTLEAESDVRVGALVEGQLASLLVDVGDEVEAGQVLAKVSDERWRAQLREMEAELARAAAEERRARELRAGNVISPAEYDTRRTAVEVARARRDSVQVLLRQAVVQAPVAGRIAERFVSEGEYVRPGTPLVRIVDDRRLRLRASVPERFTPHVRPGLPVNVRVEAFPERSFTGTVTRVAPAVDAGSRALHLETWIDNGDGKLRPGFFVSGHIAAPPDSPVVVVPDSAVVVSAGVRKVFVVDGPRVRERRVQTGDRREGWTEIVSGLPPGALVVTSRPERLVDGAAVRILEEGE